MRRLLVDSLPLWICISALSFGGCNAHQRQGDLEDDGRQIAELQQPLTPPLRLIRYENAIASAFDSERAMDTVRFVDGFFRVRGNVGYQKCLAQVKRSLIDGGFDSLGYEVNTLELGPEKATWTAVKARLELLGDRPVVLHEFADETGRDRATLLVGSASLSSTDFDVVLDEHGLDSVSGKVVLGRGSPRSLLKRHVGAAGILTVNLEDYHRAAEEPDVAQFGYLPSDVPQGAFGFSISPRVSETLETAISSGNGSARIRVTIETKHGTSTATTIEAVIVGSDPRAYPVVMVAHIDEPGANDNASGVAALLELAHALRRGIESGSIPRPRHSLVFLWGQEIECSQEWLELRRHRALAGLVFDMVGSDQQIVGAPLLVERMPDPGAVWIRPPDSPSGWGSAQLDARRMRGHFLTDYVLAAVRSLSPPHQGWQYRDHPFEGGSDHLPFLWANIPALLLWHFPDSAYHTNLDRTDRISGQEMEQVAVAFGAVAIGLSSGLDDDRLESLSAVEHGARRRLNFVREASRAALVQGSPLVQEQMILDAWLRWYDEALTSVSQGSPSPELSQRVEEARERVQEQGEVLRGHIGATRAP